MPTPRKLRVLFLTALAILITILFFTSKMRKDSSEDNRSIQDFYHKTKYAIDHKNGDGSQVIIGGKGGTVVEPHIKDKDGDGTVSEDDEQLARDMADRLRAAEAKAKELANAKAPKPDPPSEVVGVGSAAGAKKEPLKVDVVGSRKKMLDEDSEPASNVDPAELEVETTLAQILKKSPVVIFSKSYCPFSKRAKGLLLDKYQIEPTPYVVELDQHEMGAELQAKLASMTGRRTVPNILVNGKSVGGSEEIAAMDKQDVLIDTIKDMGGKRVTMEERFAD